MRDGKEDFSPIQIHLALAFPASGAAPRELLPEGGGGSMGATAAVQGAGRGGRLLGVRWGHWQGTVAD